MLDPPIRTLLVQIIEDAAGKEICGFLIRNSDGRQAFVRLPNWSGDPDGFFVAESEASRITQYVKEKGQEIIAFLHSQNSTLELSKDDLQSLQHSNLPWVVAWLSPSGLQAITVTADDFDSRETLYGKGIMGIFSF
jgi:proteasome lid subunit RPN8/RPN11